MSMHKIELTEWEREGLELHRLPIGKPSQLSDTFRAGVQFATRKTNETIVDLAKRNCALQAKIDSLMLEFCPKEMTKEQIERWGENQVVGNINDYILKTSGGKYLDDFAKSVTHHHLFRQAGETDADFRMRLQSYGNLDYIRSSFELSGLKCADSTWKHIIKAAAYFEDNK